MSDLEKWAAARVWAAHQAPYLAHALLTLEPVLLTDSPDGTAPRPDLRRFPADTGWHIYVGTEELARQRVPEIGFWLIHQVSHLLREHARRYPGDADERLTWNLATDAEINDDLDPLLPAGTDTPAQLGLPAGQTAEQYWHALRGRPAVEGFSHGQPTTDEVARRHGTVEEVAHGQPATSEVPREHQATDEVARGHQASEEDAHGHLASEEVADGDCGSACDGLPRPWDCGLPGLSATSARLTALDTARRIRERLNARDDVPAGWRRWAEDVLEPSVNWRRLLAAKVRHGLAQAAGGVDYTYRRPSRRAAALPGVVLPGLRRPLPCVTVLIDTSGSITDTMLSQALAEVHGVLRAVGIGRRLVSVTACDARAYRPQIVGRVSDLRLGGGGGTDLRAGFAAALASRRPPDLIVAITDGRTPWPDRPPAGTRVVVGLLDADGRAPAWAHTVLIEEDR